ncbi:nucleotide pyrophosphohydrolase [Paenisporosarcina sp. TG-14]|uniref:nucleotide pyrophosphohydrolase n=1 Tax=Paenisporosarcina sp. TG-14 TaxID=1231057 RepID=UPI00031863E5|nr:nucleotide pyrophosphohydrolase [Paenisporosarcina sp. TG-14]
MKEIIQDLQQFSNNRGWNGNHDARSLAISISLEASELLECFQWRSGEEAITHDKQAIIDEMADVFIYLLQLSDVLGEDLIMSARDKMKKNAIKYPVPSKI